MLILATALSFQLLENAPGRDRLFEAPVAVRCHPDGRVFVTDDAGHRIVVFDASGRRLQTLGGYGSGPGQLLFPDAVHWDDEGLLYVADAGANRVQVWTGDGRHLSDIGRAPWWRRGAGALVTVAGAAVLWSLAAAAVMAWWPRRGQALVLALVAVAIVAAAGLLTFGRFNGLRNPRDVLLGRDGLVYVADFTGNAVRVFSRAGALVRSIGTSGPASARVTRPLGLAFSPDGLLLVTDSGNHRIQVFAPDGRHVGSFGQHGSGEEDLDQPHGITVDVDGRVYVADRGNRRIQIRDSGGRVIGTIAGGPEAPQPFTPGGVSLCGYQQLLIADLAGRRVLARDRTRGDSPGPGR